MFDKPTFTISAASGMCNMHPQTLRQYEQRGLICPHRTPGGTRMYSMKDIMRLEEISTLSASGVSLEGISQIFSIKDEMEKMQAEMQELLDENMALRAALHKERTNRRAIVSSIGHHALLVKGNTLPAAPVGGSIKGGGDKKK